MTRREDLYSYRRTSGPKRTVGTPDSLFRTGILLSFLLLLILSSPQPAASDSTGEHEVERLVAALLASTPMEEDLQELTDNIGGRPTGSRANLDSVGWAMDKFAEIGLEPKKEAFEMPKLWLEQRAEISISGGSTFDLPAAAMPFSVSTPPLGQRAPLVDGGFGTPADFERLGESAVGAFVLVETELLLDLAGLFKSYADGVEIERRAFESGAAGLLFMGARPGNALYRHNAAKGPANEHLLLIAERDGARRALRLLRSGAELDAKVKIDVNGGGSFESYNVIADIPGSERPEEIVLLGAHLDSWGLGTGALDNGCNVVMLIDIARQIQALGLRPARTLRFALFNGEEQGLVGSWKYTVTHADELDDHIVASSFDIGSGAIRGFFTGGRPELAEVVTEMLDPVAGLGPFQQIDIPLVGTDNYDFMMQGVPNLIGNQADANYGPHYHARTDTFDKVDLEQVRLNSAIAAAVGYGLANSNWSIPRQTRAELETMIDTTDLEAQMRSFAVWDGWTDRTRGRTENP